MRNGLERYRTTCPNCPNSLLKSWGSANPIKTLCPNCPNLPQVFLIYTGRKSVCIARVMCGQEIYIRAAMVDLSQRVLP